MGNERFISDDYLDILDGNVRGRKYSDDELRERFREGMRRLEEKCDYRLVDFYVQDCPDYDELVILMWKALKKGGVDYENLTGHQLMNLRRILEGEMRR